MATENHQGYIYVGLAGESALAVGAEGTPLEEGGLFRKSGSGSQWENVGKGLPDRPQVRSLLVHPENPKTIFAGTQQGVYRSDDQGDHWEALDSHKGDVWSMAFHPHDTNVMYAGYDRCVICRSDDGGATWRKTNTDKVVFPHITMHPTQIVKRVLGLASDPANPMDVYGAIEVGGLVASRDGGDNWESITDGHYTRMGPVDLHGVQVNPTSPGLVYIITQLAMFRSRSRGRDWEFVDIQEKFPGGSYCRGLIVAPDDPNTMYLAAGAGGGSAPPGTVDAGALVRSSDAGETWEEIDLGETAPTRMFQIAIDPAAPSQIHCCTRDGLVYSSHDRGVSWTKSQVPAEMSRGRHVYPMVCG